jgi:type II secretory pathway pseudopilin PulG
MPENVTRAATRENGQGLVELIVALTVLAIGIGALLTVLTSSALSLQRSDQKGTALVLAEKQIELYRGVGFRDVRLDDQLVAAAIAKNDQYSNDSSAPSASGQHLDTDTAPAGVDTNTCVPTTFGDQTTVPDECKPTQVVTGPDHRQYRIDTYIHSDFPQGGDAVETVTVIVRNANILSQTLARSASTFSSVNVANVNGKSIVKFAFSAPRADISGTNIDKASISVTLSNTNAATGQINFYVLAPPATPSSPCGSVGWTSLGAATVNGDNVYHPAGNYPASGPGPTAGTYYWYATYTGDSQNKKASSICGASMAHMTVQAGKWSPSLSVSTTASTAVVNTPILGSTLTAALTSSSGTTTGGISYSVYGPSAAAPGSCTGAGWTPIDTVTPNGDGSYNPTVGFTPTSVGTYWYYAAFAGDATNNSATSTCNSAKTVVTVPPDTFGISAIGSQNVGTAFTIPTITAQKPYGAGTDTTYTGLKTLTFTGPGISAKGNGPVYPATVTFTNGIATNVPITLFKAETTTLTATQGAITGASPSFTVSGGVTAGFLVETVGTQTAGTAFGVTIDAVDTYGNPSSYTGTHNVSWTTTPAPGTSPNGTPPTLNAPAATSVTFNSGVGSAGGLVLVNASSSSKLTVTEGAKTGTSANFTVSPAAPISIAFINCTQPTSANTTCTGSPFTTGNNGTLQANIGVIDSYGNTAVAASTMTISMTSGSTANYTVSPLSVTINAGGGQSNQLTVTPATNNANLTTITAHVTAGGFADASVQVQK